MRLPGHKLSGPRTDDSGSLLTLLRRRGDTLGHCKRSARVAYRFGRRVVTRQYRRHQVRVLDTTSAISTSNNPRRGADHSIELAAIVGATDGERLIERPGSVSSSGQCP